jgi:hypothetical protein
MLAAERHVPNIRESIQRGLLLDTHLGGVALIVDRCREPQHVADRESEHGAMT